MHTIKIFLGIRLDATLHSILDQVEPSIKNTFIQAESADYLQMQIYEDRIYLGKNLGLDFLLKELDNRELHIRSVLKQLNPIFCKENLYLFVVQNL